MYKMMGKWENIRQRAGRQNVSTVVRYWIPASAGMTAFTNIA